MSEDCTRCGASMDWFTTNGCPIGVSPWCLLAKLDAILAQRAGKNDG